MNFILGLEGRILSYDTPFSEGTLYFLAEQKKDTRIFSHNSLVYTPLFYQEIFSIYSPFEEPSSEEFILSYNILDENSILKILFYDLQKILEEDYNTIKKLFSLEKNLELKFFNLKNVILRPILNLKFKSDDNV